MHYKRKRNCKECSTEFETTRDWQVFCGTKCRVRYNKRFRETCFYCGVYGNHKDHVRPQSESGKHWFGDLEYLYSCGECNTSLNNRNFKDLEARIQFLIDRYTKKYKLDHGAVELDDDELDELGPALRKRIRAKLAKRRKAEERLIYLRHVKQSLAKHEN